MRKGNHYVARVESNRSHRLLISCGRRLAGRESESQQGGAVKEEADTEKQTQDCGAVGWPAVVNHDSDDERDQAAEKHPTPARSGPHSEGGHRHGNSLSDQEDREDERNHSHAGGQAIEKRDTCRNTNEAQQSFQDAVAFVLSDDGKSPAR